MKHLKKFEEFDMGRFSDMEMNEPSFMDDDAEENCAGCGCNCTECECENEYDEDEMQDEFDEDEAMPVKRKVWGDEVVERKKVNAGLQAYLDKQKAKKGGKVEEKSGKKAKPDFLDLDKDGNKKESMKKAAKDAKEDKGGKEDKKEDNKKPKFGSAEWQKKYGKKK